MAHAAPDSRLGWSPEEIATSLLQQSGSGIDFSPRWVGRNIALALRATARGQDAASDSGALRRWSHALSRRATRAASAGLPSAIVVTGTDALGAARCWEATVTAIASNGASTRESGTLTAPAGAVALALADAMTVLSAFSDAPPGADATSLQSSRLAAEIRLPPRMRAVAMHLSREGKLIGAAVTLLDLAPWRAAPPVGASDTARGYKVLDLLLASSSGGVAEFSGALVRFGGPAMYCLTSGRRRGERRVASVGLPHVSVDDTASGLAARVVEREAEALAIALDRLQVGPALRESMWRTLSAVLLLGEVEFAVDSVDAGRGAASTKASRVHPAATAMGAVVAAARLLCVPTAVLETALLPGGTAVGDDDGTAAIRAAECAAAQLAACLFSSLQQQLVAHINGVLSAAAASLAASNVEATAVSGVAEDEEGSVAFVVETPALLRTSIGSGATHTIGRAAKARRDGGGAVPLLAASAARWSGESATASPLRPLFGSPDLLMPLPASAFGSVSPQRSMRVAAAADPPAEAATASSGGLGAFLSNYVAEHVEAMIAERTATTAVAGSALEDNSGGGTPPASRDVVAALDTVVDEVLACVSGLPTHAALVSPFTQLLPPPHIGAEQRLLQVQHCHGPVVYDLDKCVEEGAVANAAPASDTPVARCLQHTIRALVPAAARVVANATTDSFVRALLGSSSSEATPCDACSCAVGAPVSRVPLSLLRARIDEALAMVADRLDAAGDAIFVRCLTVPPADLAPAARLEDVSSQLTSFRLPTLVAAARTRGCIALPIAVFAAKYGHVAAAAAGDAPPPIAAQLPLQQRHAAREPPVPSAASTPRSRRGARLTLPPLSSLLSGDDEGIRDGGGAARDYVSAVGVTESRVAAESQLHSMLAALSRLVEGAAAGAAASVYGGAAASQADLIASLPPPPPLIATRTHVLLSPHALALLDAALMTATRRAAAEAVAATTLQRYVRRWNARRARASAYAARLAAAAEREAVAAAARARAADVAAAAATAMRAAALRRITMWLLTTVRRLRSPPLPRLRLAVVAIQRRHRAAAASRGRRALLTAIAALQLAAQGAVYRALALRATRAASTIQRAVRLFLWRRMVARTAAVATMQAARRRQLETRTRAVAAHGVDSDESYDTGDAASDDAEYSREGEEVGGDVDLEDANAESSRADAPAPRASYDGLGVGYGIMPGKSQMLPQQEERAIFRAQVDDVADDCNTQDVSNDFRKEDSLAAWRAAAARAEAAAVLHDSAWMNRFDVRSGSTSALPHSGDSDVPRRGRMLLPDEQSGASYMSPPHHHDPDLASTPPSASISGRVDPPQRRRPQTTPPPPSALSTARQPLPLAAAAKAHVDASNRTQWHDRVSLPPIESRAR